MAESTDGLVAATLAEALRATTANLEAYIEARAAELTVARTALLEEAIASQAAEYEQRLVSVQQFSEALKQEFQRQLDGVLQRRAEANWMEGYLPEGLRPRYNSTRWPFALPSETFMAGADERARAAGVDPEAHPGQEVRARATERAARTATNSRRTPVSETTEDRAASPARPSTAIATKPAHRHHPRSSDEPATDQPN